MRTVALDFETSGLDPKRHAPVTLGVAAMEGDDVVSSLEILFAPPMKDGKILREYDVAALEISSHSWPMIKRNGVAISEGLKQLSEWVTLHDVADCDVLAFNAPFDFSFYSELLFMGGSWNQARRKFETFLPPLYGPWQCVRLAAVHKVQGLERYSLDAVAEHFGMSRSSESHSALEDAILAAKVWHRLEAIDAK